MASVFNFVAEGFESSIVLDLSGILPGGMELPTLDVSATAVYEVSLDAMKSIFLFHTDSEDVINAPESDLLFKMEDATWQALDINVANSLMATAGSYKVGDPIYTSPADNKNFVCHDFVRYLAQCLFNTHYAVDMFDNELELLNDIRTLCDGTDPAHVWGSICATVTANKGPLEYNADATNVCCALFKQMVKAAPDRFSNLPSVLIGEGADATSYYSLPFLVDDTIAFKLTVGAAENQHLLTGLADPISERTYSIVLKIVDTTANVAVADDEPSA